MPLPVGRLQALPQPVLKHLGTHEHRICRCADALLPSISGAMPGEFSQVDQYEPRECLAAFAVVHDRVERETGQLREC